MRPTWSGHQHIHDAPGTLVLLCWRHHHDFAHHPQWQLKLLPDAAVEVTTADGRTLVSRPPPTTISPTIFGDVTAA
jgi:hypothetical protein